MQLIPLASMGKDENLQNFDEEKPFKTEGRQYENGSS
jgi:hypothetical protein